MNVHVAQNPDLKRLTVGIDHNIVFDSEGLIPHRVEHALRLMTRYANLHVVIPNDVSVQEVVDVIKAVCSFSPEIKRHTTWGVRSDVLRHADVSIFYARHITPVPGGIPIPEVRIVKPGADAIREVLIDVNAEHLRTCINQGIPDSPGYGAEVKPGESLVTGGKVTKARLVEMEVTRLGGGGGATVSGKTAMGVAYDPPLKTMRGESAVVVLDPVSPDVQEYLDGLADAARPTLEEMAKPIGGKKQETPVAQSESKEGVKTPRARRSADRVALLLSTLNPNLVDEHVVSVANDAVLLLKEAIAAGVWSKDSPTT